jgi:hypothetical protein
MIENRSRNAPMRPKTMRCYQPDLNAEECPSITTQSHFLVVPLSRERSTDHKESHITDFFPGLFPAEA